MASLLFVFAIQKVLVKVPQPSDKEPPFCPLCFEKCATKMPTPISLASVFSKGQQHLPNWINVKFKNHPEKPRPHLVLITGASFYHATQIRVLDRP
jgi:hypothetical protein